MYHNFRYETINQALPSLFKELGYQGAHVPSRNGNTLELAFTSITLDRSTDREILVPGRKHNLAAQIAETMWVLSGRNDIEWLSRYLPRAADYSDDGITWRGGYGQRIRNWQNGHDGDTIDQVGYVIDLLRRDPGTRQAVIGIYDPAIDTEPGKDIPCNDFLHFLQRDGILDLHIFVRSNDVMWGWSGINVFEWSSLLEIVAGMAGMEVGALHFSVSSFHLYEAHWLKASQIVDDAGPVYVGQHLESPRFDPTGLDDMEAFHELTHQWFQAEAAIRQQAPLPTRDRHLEQMIEDFPEPMLASWLRVLAWWWTGEEQYLFPLNGTNLEASAAVALQPKRALTVVPDSDPTLIDRIVALHNEKDAAYGGSWCKRGEMLGIMANIARKIDRLGGAETADESSLDTAMDLFVYLAKYAAWTVNGGRDEANNVMHVTASKDLPPVRVIDGLEATLRQEFEQLEEAVVAKHVNKRNDIILSMLNHAWGLVSTMAAR